MNCYTEIVRFIRSEFCPFNQTTGNEYFTILLFLCSLAEVCNVDLVLLFLFRKVYLQLIFIKDLVTSHLISEIEVYQGIYVMNDDLYNRKQDTKINESKSVYKWKRVFNT